MKPNMGTIDKAARFLFAATVAVLYATGAISGVPLVVAAGLGIVMVATSLVGICPLYLPFGLSTRKKIAKSPAA